MNNLFLYYLQILLISITLATLLKEYANEALCLEPDGGDKNSKKRNSKVETKTKTFKRVLLWCTTWMPQKWINWIESYGEAEDELRKLNEAIYGP